MEKRAKKDQKSQAKLKDFVVVTFVEDAEQAKEYETLLKSNDIPALIREQIDPSMSGKDIAIMVPEDFLDEAHVVIESQDAYDDFYDFALEDEGEENFEAESFDDEF
jgi:hypothetical protein